MGSLRDPEVHPDSDLIDALGGTTEVAAVCKVSPQAVSHWRRDGIPEARRMYLRLLKPDAFRVVDAEPGVG